MKKNYFLAVLFAFGMVTANAQFNDDMESYTAGAPIYGGWWTDWGCGGTCALEGSSAFAQSGSLSGFIGASTGQDAVLDMGNKIFGPWGLKFAMYIPSGNEGYFNLQGTVPIGAGEWIVGNIYFNKDGVDPGNGYIDYSTSDTSLWTYFTFPHDQWFDVVINVDINSGIGAATWEFGVDGVVAVPAGTPFTDAASTYPTSLGGIDYYSIGAATTFYLDDFDYINAFQPITSAGISDLAAKGFTAYPNPVRNVLNLNANEEISSVVIYNVLGQQVYSAKVNALNSTVDMSGFASGAYMVKVNIGGTEGIVKILK